MIYDTNLDSFVSILVLMDGVLRVAATDSSRAYLERFQSLF